MVLARGVHDRNARSAHKNADEIARVPGVAALFACTSTGKSMREVHKGMSLTEAEFNALAEDLTWSLR
jgi:hypothetical protein